MKGNLLSASAFLLFLVLLTGAAEANQKAYIETGELANQTMVDYNLHGFEALKPVLQEEYGIDLYMSSNGYNVTGESLNDSVSNTITDLNRIQPTIMIEFSKGGMVGTAALNSMPQTSVKLVILLDAALGGVPMKADSAIGLDPTSRAAFDMNQGSPFMQKVWIDKKRFTIWQFHSGYADWANNLALFGGYNEIIPTIDGVNLIVFDDATHQDLVINIAIVRQELDHVFGCRCAKLPEVVETENTAGTNLSKSSFGRDVLTSH